MPLGVVVERRAIDNPWQRWTWLPVAVIPGAPPVREWRILREGDDFVQYHAATLPLVLHPKETAAYRQNLSQRRPAIYVGLRALEAGPHEVSPFLVTASPDEAQAYLDGGEDIIEGVAVPDVLAAWIADFIERHHVEEPFVKRRRRRAEKEHPRERTDEQRS